MHVSRNIIGIIGVALAVGAPYQTAQAKPWHHHQKHWKHAHHVTGLPHHTITLRVGHHEVYYCDGRYYRKPWWRREYVAVPAPAGVVVPSIPQTHRTVVIDGVTYHEYDGVYYRGGPAGYTVVPLAQADPSAGSILVDNNSLPAAPPSATVVNVPNRNGSYTPVPLQVASTGMYVGPKGEVYPNLPSAQQLQEMYGN